MSEENINKLESLNRKIISCESTEMNLQRWRSSLQQSSPSEKMMRWMATFDQPCDRSCCWSPECAITRCDNCYKALTTSKHMKRYECMGCLKSSNSPLSNSPLSNSSDDSPPPPSSSSSSSSPSSSSPSSSPSSPSPSANSFHTFCEECFHKESIKHQHAKNFCEIDERGNHRRLERPVASVPLKLLQESDFTPIAGFKGECCVCLFKDSAVSPAFCQRGHNLGKFVGENVGFESDSGFMCSGCYFDFEKKRVKPRLFYCDPKSFCDLCMFEDEMVIWRRDFDLDCSNLLKELCNPVEKENAEEENNSSSSSVSTEAPSSSVINEANKALLIEKMRLKFTELHELHLQGWIRQVLRASFTAFARESDLDVSF